MRVAGEVNQTTFSARVAPRERFCRSEFGIVLISRWRVCEFKTTLKEADMRTTKHAIVEWIPRELGGRTKPPECLGDQTYSTAVRLLDSGEPWPPPILWTLVVRKSKVLDHPMRWLVDINFLVDEAPHHLLVENTKFELYEGKRCVAKGEIIEGIVSEPREHHT